MEGVIGFRNRQRSLRSQRSPNLHYSLIGSWGMTRPKKLANFGLTFSRSKVARISLSTWANLVNWRLSNPNPSPSRRVQSSAWKSGSRSSTRFCLVWSTFKSWREWVLARNPKRWLGHTVPTRMKNRFTKRLVRHTKFVKFPCDILILKSIVEPEEAPSGMMARAHYNAVSKFIDDDNHTHLKFEWSFNIKKDW